MADALNDDEAMAEFLKLRAALPPRHDTVQYANKVRGEMMLMHACLLLPGCSFTADLGLRTSFSFTNVALFLVLFSTSFPFRSAHVRGADRIFFNGNRRKSLRLLGVCGVVVGELR
jgi:hypothetical protein